MLEMADLTKANAADAQDMVYPSLALPVEPENVHAAPPEAIIHHDGAGNAGLPQQLSYGEYDPGMQAQEVAVPVLNVQQEQNVQQHEPDAHVSHRNQGFNLMNSIQADRPANNDYQSSIEAENDF